MVAGTDCSESPGGCFFNGTEEIKLVPAWSGFNAAVQDSSTTPAESTASYYPVIGASPTRFDCVYTLLARTVAMAKPLHLQDTVVVVDQATYAKAFEIVCKHKEEFKSVVLRLGSFHTCLDILAVLGKRFEHSGLRDLLVESGVVTEGSVDGVLNGRHYNRSVQIHKLVLEALFRLQLQAFEKWCSTRHLDINFAESARRVSALRQRQNHDTQQAFLACTAFTLITAAAKISQ